MNRWPDAVLGDERSFHGACEHGLWKDRGQTSGKALERSFVSFFFLCVPVKHALALLRAAAQRRNPPTAESNIADRARPTTSIDYVANRRRNKVA